MLNGTIMGASSSLLATVVSPGRMRDLSSNSHRIPTMRRIMGVMGTAWKVVIGLVLVLPMTAYVVGSLVAVADEPPEHAPIIVEEQTQAPSDSGRPSGRPTDRPSDEESDDRGRNRGPGGGDDDDETPEVITPSPSEFDDDDDDDDNSGQGRGRGRGGDDDGDDDNSGPGSDDD
jgi:hypothetical protein